MSYSGKENGWSSYPLDVWNKTRPMNKLDDLPFWKYCAEKYGDPILDLCCGNGRITLSLAGLGYDVAGVDINEDFIVWAKKQAKKIAEDGRKIRVSFYQQDIVNLKIDKTFRLAIMPDWSFQGLLTMGDQLVFFQLLREHLLTGGVFAFSTFIPFHRQRKYGGLIEKKGVWEWSSDSSYHPGSRRIYDPVSQIETIFDKDPIKLRHTNFSEIKLLLQLTGFEIVELYGDDDRRPFTGHSDDDYTIIAKRI